MNSNFACTSSPTCQITKKPPCKFVQNHALRRADLRERTLTTVFPKPPEEESVVESLWSRLLPAFLRRPPPPPSTFSEPRPSAADDEAESARPWFPWHIAMIEEGVLAVASAG